MWLILSSPDDDTGIWLREGLEARGLEPIEALTTNDLLRSTTWVHTVGTDGARFTAQLSDGRRIVSDEISGAINRIGYIAPSDAATVTPDDRDYVVQEQYAFFLSWLAAIPGPVFNPPKPRGLAGAWRPPSEWVWLAAQAGLSHDPFRSSNNEPQTPWMSTPPAGPIAITVGEEIVDNGLSDDVKHACLRLAQLAETPLLGVYFRPGTNGEPVFAGASPQPPIELAGDAILDAFAYVFQERAET